MTGNKKTRVKALEHLTQPQETIIHVCYVDRHGSDNPEVIQVTYEDKDTHKNVTVSQAEYYRRFPELVDVETIDVRYDEPGEK
jgi:hypothetical protein